MPCQPLCRGYFLLWLAVYSDSIFPQHTLGWQENPTVAVVETLAEPIDRIQFPAVSICPQTFNSDRWGPTLKILDHLKPMHPSYGLVLTVLCVLIKISQMKLFLKDI